MPGNPSLREAHRRTGRAVVGGLPAKPEIAGLAPSEVEARGRRAIAEMAGRFLVLGPDCSINPDTPETVMDAATRGDPLRGYADGGGEAPPRYLPVRGA